MRCTADIAAVLAVLEAPSTALQHEKQQEILDFFISAKGKDQYAKEASLYPPYVASDLPFPSLLGQP